jgi:hypothetical protein
MNRKPTNPVIQPSEVIDDTIFYFIKKIIINQLMDDHEKVNHSTEHFMQLHRRSDGLSSKQLCDLLDHDTLIVP